MVFRKGGPLMASEHWTFDGEEINIAPFYKYMGLLLTPKLSWSKLDAQALKSINCIKHYQKYFGYFNYNEHFKLFDSMVKPILVHGAEIWGYHYSKIVERVQIQYCRTFLGVSKSTNNDVVLGECGRLPLYIDYVAKLIKYRCKLLQMRQQRFPRQCYIMLRDLDVAGRQTWASEVRQILFKFGFGYAWIAQEVADVKVFINQFKIRLSDCIKQDWHNNINNSPRCDNYKQFKSLLDVEFYLKIDLPFYLRRSFAKFRCSNHRLGIELGRQWGIPREDRLCTYCLQQNIIAIEDEYHVFSLCKRYDEIRAFYLDHMSNTSPPRDLFYRKMASINKDELYNICRFIHRILTNKC